MQEIITLPLAGQEINLCERIIPPLPCAEIKRYEIIGSVWRFTKISQEIQFCAVIGSVRRFQQSQNSLQGKKLIFV